MYLIISQLIELASIIKSKEDGKLQTTSVTTVKH